MNSIIWAKAVLALAMKYAGLAGYDESANQHIQAVASSVAAVTMDNSDAETLLKIARYEGGFSKEVATCRKKSSHGAVGPWQIIPVTKTELDSVCGDLSYAAVNALEKMHASKEACHWNHKTRGAWELDVYVSGKCDKGRSFSLARWGDGKELADMISEIAKQNVQKGE